MANPVNYDSSSLFKGLYKQYYQREPDAQELQDWIAWYNGNRKPEQNNQDFNNFVKDSFKGAVIKDVQNYGLGDIKNIPGVTSTEFLTRFNQQLQLGLDPVAAKDNVISDLKGLYIKPTTEKVTDPVTGEVKEQPIETPAQKIERVTNEALTPENISKYTNLVREMYNPEFKKSAKNIAEQYAGMGRDYSGDAYNRAMAGLAGDYQSKNFNDALNLIGQDTQNRLAGSGAALNWTNLSTGTDLANKNMNYQSLMALLNRGYENQDYSDQGALAKELAKTQAGNKTPDWAYWLDAFTKVLPEVI